MAIIVVKDLRFGKTTFLDLLENKQIILADKMERFAESGVEYFVHEFDEIDSERLAYRPDAYYVTSPLFVRPPYANDFLTGLVKANEGVFCSYGFLGDHQHLLNLIGEEEYLRQTNFHWRTDQKL